MHNIYTLITQLSNIAIAIPFCKLRYSLLTYMYIKLIAIKHATIKTLTNSFNILISFFIILKTTSSNVPNIIFKNILHELIKQKMHKKQKHVFIYAPPNEYKITTIGNNIFNNIAEKITIYLARESLVFATSELIRLFNTSAPSLL